jgi:glutathione peroxidase
MKRIASRTAIMALALSIVAGSCAIGLKAYSASPDRGKHKRTGGKKMTEKSVLDFKARALSGEEIDLSRYKGKVLVIVNTASKCGFTPQYAGLEKLYEKYKDKGLEILGFPCNQFGGQEPGSDEEIANFCQKNYGVDFQMFEKVDVNGADAHPLYKFLTHEAPGALKTEAIKWNFTKFLVDKNGKVLKRFAPNVAPKDLESDIEKQL